MLERDYNDYLNHINFAKRLNKLKKVLKNKSVIIYGTGSLFQYAKSKYDLSFINVIGVSDVRLFSENGDEKFQGYRIVNRTNLAIEKPDVVLVSTLEYSEIIDNFADLKEENIEVLPLFKKTFLDTIKEFFFED